MQQDKKVSRNFSHLNSDLKQQRCLHMAKDSCWIHSGASV